MPTPFRSLTRGRNSKKELIIPIMGATGAGKSTFVNHLLSSHQSKVEVGHMLTSCTTDLQPIVLQINDPELQDYQITIVDTPGFDDTYTADAAILKLIADWLEKAYRQGKILGGVIYLHDVSSDRFSGTARRNLEMFNHMCGDAALEKVVIGTTKWTRTAPDIAVRHEKELKSVHWKPMIDKKAEVRKFEDSTASALDFVKTFVRKMLWDAFLAIQTEIVDDKKIIPETAAGQKLRYTLKEILDMQKKMVELEAAMAKGGGDDLATKVKETQQKISILTSQIRELQIPLSRKLRRILKIFGLS